MMFNELLLLWATWGRTPVYWAVAKAKGQISPAINATNPAHIHAAVLVYSSYLCGICCNDISLCQSLISWFILDLITCRGHMNTPKSGQMTDSDYVCAGVLGKQRGSVQGYLWWNQHSFSTLFAPILSLYYDSCLLNGIFSSPNH